MNAVLGLIAASFAVAVYCFATAAYGLGEGREDYNNGQARLDGLDLLSDLNSARFYAGEITEEEDVANRSYFMRERLIAAGELRSDQKGRPLLVTAMRRER